MDQIFKALAAAPRRQVLDRLFAQPGLTLNELVDSLESDGLGMRRQSATRHIAVLERAGLIASQWHGREKRHYLNPIPLQQITRRWLDKFSEARAEALLNLKQALESAEGES